MHDLTIISQNGNHYIDSREVAEVIGKPHNDLMKSIRKYGKYLTAGNFPLSDFFIESSYIDKTGRTLICYLLSKKGCELTANKITGKKGVLFTAAYVTRFNEMEKLENSKRYAELADSCMKAQHIAGRILTAVFDAACVPDKQKNDALRGIYNELGLKIPLEASCIRQTYPVSEITRRFGILSLNGRPHTTAVSAIISMLHIADEHKLVVPYQNVTFIGYDEYTVNAVRDWILKNNFPCEIECFGKTYKVRYRHRELDGIK